MEKALAIIHHYGSGNADFVIRANGKMEWDGPGSEPTDEECEQWDVERLANIAANAWTGEREIEYNKEGCTEKALLVALWEKVVEGRPEAADALEIKRQAVKIKFEKP